MHDALKRTDHRPWPLPRGRWAWRQSWRDLLFAHWPVPAAALQPLVPPALEVQEFEGTSWIGVVPFKMAGVMRRPLPDFPGISAFPECNLRLYVEHGGRPGVWFLSLDATQPLAVWAARRFFHLPYYKADISVSAHGDGFDYEVKRVDSPPASMSASYDPSSPAYEAKGGTLEAWLTERYCLYAEATDKRLFRTEVHHPPWSLQKAEAEVDCNGLLAPHALRVDGPAPLLHFSKRIDVIIWPPERIDSA
jgi:uncharacterized protein YqjF (DUF2071 family)